MNDQYSDAFKSIVPDAPSAEGWAAGARRRRRRRLQAVTGSAVLALVMAVVIPLGLGFGGSDQRMVATPAPTPSQTTEAEPTPLEPDACRDEDGNYPAVTDLPDNELPLGVERVWLCGGPSTGFTSGTFVGAPEPLTLNADWAVAVFMEPAPTVGSIECEANNSIGFTVVYEYTGGDRHTVRGSLGDCDAVVSGASYRMGAGEYLEELRALWDAQRKQEDTSFDAEIQVCPARTSVMGVGIGDMARAYACGPVGDEEPATGSVQIPLSDALVADMVEEITSQDVMVGIEPGLSMEAPSLVFLSPEGDPFTIQGTPEGYRWYDPEPRGMYMWTPSPGLKARIYDEMTRDNICTAPPRLVPADVQVDVYDAGGGSDSVALVEERLAQAGFDVAITGESAVQNLGSPVIVRGSNGNQGVDLVGGQFTGVGGEMSREDDVVDVLVTTLFDDESPPFAAEPATDVPIGTITCSAPSAAPEPSAMSTPSSVPPFSQPPNAGELSVDEACSLDAEGRMTTTELPGDTLPDGPVAVWLCPGGGAPAEPLVGEKATQQVVDSFRELPTTADGGLRRVYYHAYVLVDYPGGERYVIEVDANASPGVRWGAQRQRTRYGAAQWYSQLAELWREQRNNTPQSPPIAPQVGVCDGVTWNLGRGIDRYDEDGALCAGIITDSGAQIVEVAASPSLIAEVRTEAMESRTPWLPDGEGNLLNDWMGDFIILVDDYGDRLPLIPGSDGTWYWREGDDPWKWTPSRGLANKLDQAFDAGRPSPQPTSS